MLVVRCRNAGYTQQAKPKKYITSYIYITLHTEYRLHDDRPSDLVGASVGACARGGIFFKQTIQELSASGRCISKKAQLKMLRKIVDGSQLEQTLILDQTLDCECVFCCAADQAGCQLLDGQSQR